MGRASGHRVVRHTTSRGAQPLYMPTRWLDKLRGEEQNKPPSALTMYDLPMVRPSRRRVRPSTYQTIEVYSTQCAAPPFQRDPPAPYQILLLLLHSNTAQMDKHTSIPKARSTST